jgi:cytidyltransferase-like protein
MEWSKKIHVESSMEKKKNQYSMFIGRWQPLHQGHKMMFEKVLEEGGNVYIAIKDVEPDMKNSFTPLEVLGNIMNEYDALIQEGRVKVQVIPDICSVEFERGVGYSIIEHIPPTDVAEISATKIKEKMLLESKGKYGL